MEKAGYLKELNIFLCKFNFLEQKENNKVLYVKRGTLY